MRLSFVKMQGLGNDFVVLDARQTPLPSGLYWAKIADRTLGIGCDQVIVLEASDKADVKMRIINADGSEVEACGNATRCVGWLLNKPQATIETLAGVLSTQRTGETEIEVDMGVPEFGTRSLPIAGEPVEVSMGNPHLVFFIEKISMINPALFGPQLETHEAFPDRTNVEWAQVLSPSHIQMKVWERGVGVTQACGTGACAVAAAAIQQGKAQSPVQVEMPGGSLWISWAGGNHKLLMRGEISLIFHGELDVDNYQ